MKRGSHMSAPTISRRRFIAASAATLGAISAAGVAAPWNTSGPRAADASGHHYEPSADGFVDAVLTAFESHRLVAVGEVHGLQEYHDALAELLADPRLPRVVDDVVVEFGNALYQTTMDRFTAGFPVDNADLRQVWRNTTQSPLATWDAPVYEHIYRTIRAVNALLPPHKRIRVLLGDSPIDWSKITSRDELTTFLMQRDSHAASVVAREVLEKKRRALICYGAGHVLHGSVIEQQTGERPYVIATLVALSGDPGGLARRLSRYPRRTVIPTSGSWLGSFDAGNVFPAPSPSPSGGPINRMCGIPLGSVIDAGLYVCQPKNLTVSRENPAIYLDPAYWTELQRRNTLYGGVINLDSYRQEQPVRYEPLALPPSLQCP
jgi:hypothetical protein